MTELAQDLLVGRPLLVFFHVDLIEPEQLGETDLGLRLGRGYFGTATGGPDDEQYGNAGGDKSPDAASRFPSNRHGERSRGNRPDRALRAGYAVGADICNKK